MRRRLREFIGEVLAARPFKFNLNKHAQRQFTNGTEWVATLYGVTTKTVFIGIARCKREEV